VIAAVVGLVVLMFFLFRAMMGAGSWHPMLCWRISPMYDPGECVVESTKLDQ
jgi:hypothetical protein